MRFFQRALLEFNNLFIHFIFREFNCVSISKIPSPLVEMESWTRRLGGHIFSCSRENHIFFFGIIWNSTNLACVPQFRWECLVYDYPFLRGSHSVPDMDFFCYTVTYFVPLELSRIELLKLIRSILMDILIISFVLVDQFYFYMHQPIKLDFLKSLSLR